MLCLAVDDGKYAKTVQMLTFILKEKSGVNSARQHLALLCLGEIGGCKDLSQHANTETIVIESFQSPFEEIKSAASYALGNIAVKNLSKYLPFILNQIDKQQKKQYLLVHSLKEKHTHSPAAFTRATIVIAVKYTFMERPEKIDHVIQPYISSFLMLIKYNDRHVLRAAVSTLSTATHNKPDIIKGLLRDLLPILYEQTIIKQELIRTIDLGPFKHTVDDGLEL